MYKMIKTVINLKLPLINITTVPLDFSKFNKIFIV